MPRRRPCDYQTLETNFNKRALAPFASTFHHCQLIGYVIQNKNLPLAERLNIREDALWAWLKASVVDSNSVS